MPSGGTNVKTFAGGGRRSVNPAPASAAPTPPLPVNQPKKQTEGARLRQMRARHLSQLGSRRLRWTMSCSPESTGAARSRSTGPSAILDECAAWHLWRPSSGRCPEMSFRRAHERASKRFGRPAPASEWFSTRTSLLKMLCARRCSLGTGYGYLISIPQPLLSGSSFLGPR